MANRDPSRAFAEEVYASCMTIGFTNDDVQTLKTMLDATTAQDGDVLNALALRAQASALRWAMER